MNVGELLPQVVKNRKLRYHQKSGVLHFLPEDDKQELVFLSSIVVQLWEPYTTIARPWWGLILRISLVDVRGPPEEFYVELTECLGNVSGTVHSHREIGLWKWHPRWLITNSLHMPRSSIFHETANSKTQRLETYGFSVLCHASWTSSALSLLKRTVCWGSRRKVPKARRIQHWLVPVVAPRWHDRRASIFVRNAA